MLKGLVHLILKHYSQKRHRSFLAHRDQVRWTQDKILTGILKNLSSTEAYAQRLNRDDLSYDYFQRHFPVTQFNDYRQAIEKQQTSLKPIISPLPQRYQPTSGSSNSRKWIPYTKKFLSEIDQASLVWMHDLYLTYPQIRKGTHYWSLSWLPNDLREKQSNSDLEYLDRVTKTLLSQVMAIPQDVQNTPSLTSSFFATLCWLVSREDLSFIFVWSPTFFLSLMREIENDRQAIVETLVSGEWAKHAGDLKKS